MTVSRLVALSLMLAAACSLTACKRSMIDEAGNTLRVDPDKPPKYTYAPPPPHVPTAEEQRAAAVAQTDPSTLKPGTPPARTRR